MDKTTLRPAHARAEGFPGQILQIIPRSVLRREEHHPLLQPLHLTHTGWYPRARGHYRRRPEGASECILICCFAGRGWYELNGRRTELGPGRILLIPRRLPHAYGADERRPWSIAWAHFSGTDADFYSRLVPARDFQLSLPPVVRARARRLFGEIHAVLGEGYLRPNLVHAAHILRHLLGLIFYGNPAYSPELRAAPGRSLQPALDFLGNHLAERLRLADIARAAGLSAPHFSALFRRQTGMPPMAHLNHLRIRHACRLLDTTALNIAETARHCGFEDQFHFSRAFRRIMGLPPRQYRRQRKG